MGENSGGMTCSELCKSILIFFYKIIVNFSLKINNYANLLKMRFSVIWSKKIVKTLACKEKNIGQNLKFIL